MRLTSAFHLSWLLPFLALALSACGKEPNIGHEDGPHYVTGSLQDHVHRILTSGYEDDCDLRIAASMREIAQALDERRAEIDELMRNQPPSNRYRKVTLGPTYVREPIASTSPTSSWTEYTLNWADYIRQYQQIKNTPVDERWIRLNNNVRTIVSDDQYRVIKGVNYYLNKDSGPQVEALYQAVSTCHADPACTRPSLTSDLESFVTNNRIYNWYWTHLSGSNARTILRRFNNRMTSDLSQFQYKKNMSVTRTRADELTLPLDLGVFSVAEAQFIRYIEEVWTSNALKLKVRPSDASLASGVFKVLFDNIPGGRAYVMYTTQVMQLFPDVRSRTLAHEVGHILGFSDRYYTIWEPSHCRYRVQYNPSDLMSDSDTGVVAADDWQTLNTQYPMR